MGYAGRAEQIGWCAVKGVCFLLVSVWLQCLPVVAQQGFTSLACGSDQRTNFTDSAGIIWTSDDSYVQTGVKVNISAESASRLRYFPTGTKNCYNFDDVTPARRYLIRGTFLYANYDGLNRPPRFDVAIEATPVFVVQFDSNSLSNFLDPEVHEVIVTAQRSQLSYCLLATPDSGSPLISKLEIRQLPKRSYDAEKTAVLKLLLRIDCGSIAPARYPADNLDRIWSGETQTLRNFTTTGNITAEEKQTPAPEAMLRTAQVADGVTRRLDYLSTSPNSTYPYRVNLYFAEIDPNISVGDKVFGIYANDVLQISQVDILKIGPPFSGYSLGFHMDENYSTTLNISLVPTETSRELPSLNGIEIYQVVQVLPGTSRPDVQALLSVKDDLNFTESNWSGDPCLPSWQTKNHNQDYTSWEGLSCQLINNMTDVTVTGLNLSNRNIRGTIPISISYLHNLEYLILANNSFFGGIPDLSSLVNLNTLDLRDNKLTGTIPFYLFDLPSLTILRLDDNCFWGKVPVQSNRPNLTISYSGNPDLSVMNLSKSSARSSHGLPLKIIIGAFVGATILACIITMLVVTYCYRKRRAKLAAVASAFNLGKADGPMYIMKTPLQYPNDIELQIRDVKELTLKEVEVTTGNFASRIGEGGFGAVYLGTLADGSSVAVKVRSLTSNQGTREFYTEITLLSDVRHDNLVPLLGYCSENQQQILVYPYMSNGSLHDRLYGDSAVRKPLDWQTRLNIVLGAARGISFLHTGGSRCIIHRDVKSSNILLDDSMKAKIADFGLSKYSPVDGDSLVSTEVRGTAGYLDPEYYSTQQLTEKSDVFSFGIVLLEIVCGREPLSVQRPRKEWSLPEWVRPYFREANIQPIIDPAIAGSYTTESLWRVLETAIQSVEPQSSRRPTMADVVRELEDALIIESNASQYMASIQSLDTYCIPTSDLKPPPAFPLTFPFEPSPVFSDTVDPPDPR